MTGATDILIYIYIYIDRDIDIIYIYIYVRMSVAPVYMYVTCTPAFCPQTAQIVDSLIVTGATDILVFQIKDCRV